MSGKKGGNMMTTENLKVGEQMVYQITEGLVQAGGHWLARPLIRLVRFRKRDELIKVESAPKPNPAQPAGPFRLPSGGPLADLLIFVPRNLISRMIDDATGGYGYSHVTVDCGEVDGATGKRVMFESMQNSVVHRSFQDEYGPRAFLRIPLEGLPVDRQEFYECIRSKLGEAYDKEDALTWGALHDPAKQICTGLAVHCLPDWMKEEIIQAHRLGLLSRLAVSIHPSELWVSPNGFCEYFGAPPGRKVQHTNQLFVPSAKRSLKLHAIPKPNVWLDQALPGKDHGEESEIMKRGRIKVQTTTLLFVLLGLLIIGLALSRRRHFQQHG